MMILFNFFFPFFKAFARGAVILPTIQKKKIRQKRTKHLDKAFSFLYNLNRIKYIHESEIFYV